MSSEPSTGSRCRSRITSAFVVVLLLTGGCSRTVGLDLGDGSSNDSSGTGDFGYDWDLPPGFAPPPVPDDNPQTPAKVELGRWLFYDLRMSANENRACGLCHEQVKAFVDGFARSIGTHGDFHPRNAQGLTNIGYRAPLTWANPESYELETQLLGPLLGVEPIIELGMGGRESELLALFRDDSRYAALFPAAFPNDAEPGTLENMAAAIAAFQRTLISGSSRYDRYLAGEVDALSPMAIRGMTLFFGERAGCSSCHGGQDFDRPTDSAGIVGLESGFHNVGLYDVDGQGSYPDQNGGLFERTGIASDMGRFRVPTLRNVELSRPYMHDGSVPTLELAVEVMAGGGRHVQSGPNAGDGRNNRYKDEAIYDRQLSEAQRAELVVFVRSLTDHGFASEPRIANPFPDVPPDASYEAVEALFAFRCGCHQTAEPAAGLDLSAGVARSNLIDVPSSSSLALVAPGRPDDSYLVHKITGSHLVVVGGGGDIMPPPDSSETWAPLTAQQAATLRSWIRLGARAR